MNHLNRRNALRMMIGLPAAASAIHIMGCKSPSGSNTSETHSEVAKVRSKVSDKTPCLNVILHGMFALNFDYKNSPNTLAVCPPKVYGHTYGAGDWRNESFLDLEDGLYSLKNASATNPMTNSQVHQLPGALISWSISKITGVQPPGSDVSPYCTMQLGIPDNVWSLRQLVRSSTDTPFFEGQTAVDNNLDAVVSLPLIHVLNYTGVDPNNPPNFGDWTGKVGASFWNLHIIAESSFYAGPGHLSHGLAKMCQMFAASSPLQLKFKSGNNTVFNVVPTDLSTGHSTVMEQEEEALEEIRTGFIADTSKTSKVHNCMKVITINE